VQPRIGLIRGFSARDNRIPILFNRINAVAKRGRPKGSKNTPRLHLTSQVIDDADGKKPTAAERHRALKWQVAVYVHGGMDVVGIAAVMGMTIEKLRVLFAWELQHGWALVHAEELRRLDAQSAEGKTAATKLALATGGAERPAENPEADAAKARHDNVIELALKLMHGGKK